MRKTLPTMALCLIIGCSDSTTSQPPAQSVHEQLARAEKQRQEIAFQKSVLFVRAIKAALRDPDSVVWEEIRSNDDASIICVEYRAKNGYGGMNRSHAVFAKGKASETTAAWNKHCTQALTVRKDVKYAATNWQ